MTFNSGTGQEGYWQPASIGRNIIICMEADDGAVERRAGIVASVWDPDQGGTVISAAGFDHQGSLVTYNSICHKNGTVRGSAKIYWEWPTYLPPIPVTDADIKVPGE